MSICSCLYPLHIVDRRDGGENDPIEYLAFPQEVIDELGVDENGHGKFKIPKIRKVREKDLEGIDRDWVKIIWADSSFAKTKKYEVNDHLVVAGCDMPVECRFGNNGNNGKGKGKGSHKCKIKCEEKEVYEVLHPLDEWHSHHIVEI